MNHYDYIRAVIDPFLLPFVSPITDYLTSLSLFKQHLLLHVFTLLPLQHPEFKDYAEIWESINSSRIIPSTSGIIPLLCLRGVYAKDPSESRFLEVLIDTGIAPNSEGFEECK